MFKLSTVPFILATALVVVPSTVCNAQYVNWIIDDRCPEERRVLQEQDNTHVGDIKDASKLRSRNNHIEKKRDENESRFLQSSDDEVTFNLRMHWEKDSCWQREMIERKWCLQCPGSSCDSGDSLWIFECNERDEKQRFELVYLGLGDDNKHTGLLKVAGEDLCLEQVSSGSFELDACDDSNPDQKLIGFDPYRPFELQPADSTTSVDNCLSQDHHPKPYEELKSIPCYVARRDRTSYWDFYKRSEIDISTRNPDCSPTRPCDACVGDCDKDADCKGSLRCYQRWGQYGSQSVPGCSGTPQDLRK